MTSDLTRLREIAEAAMKRPEPATRAYTAMRQAQEQFYALISPQAVLELLDRVEGLERALGEAEEAPDATTLFEALEAAWVDGTDTPTLALQAGRIWIGDAAFDAKAVLRALTPQRETER